MTLFVYCVGGAVLASAGMLASLFNGRFACALLYLFAADLFIVAGIVSVLVRALGLT